MLLSVQELMLWTGLGPFEVALHSFGFIVFTCLVTLQLEGVISTSWHSVFSPLYVAVGLQLYYLSVMSVRMAVWGFQPPLPTKRTLLAFIIASGFAGVAVLFYAEYATAAYLNGTGAKDNLITSFVCLFVYLFIRLIFIFRSLKSIPDF